MTEQSGRILVVDDEAKNRCILRLVLEPRGHTVQEAASGEDALQLVAEAPPDVVLLDIVMPGLSGVEVCRRIKENPATAHIPVLLVSGLTEREDRLRGIEAGANDFISKPVDQDELALRVRNAVHGKRLFDQLQEKYRELRELAELREQLTQMIEQDNRALDAMIRWVKAHGGHTPDAARQTLGPTDEAVKDDE